MLDWNACHAPVLRSVVKVGRLGPDTPRGHPTLGKAGSKPNHLDAEVCELIFRAEAVKPKEGKTA